jgi:hypothetical protein
VLGSINEVNFEAALERVLWAKSLLCLFEGTNKEDFNKRCRWVG